MYPLPGSALVEDLDRSAAPFHVFTEIDIVDAAEQRTFAFDLPFGEIQIPHGPGQSIGAVSDVRVPPCHPRML